MKKNIDALLRQGATMDAMVSSLISSGLSSRTEKGTRLRIARHLSHLQVDDGYEVRRDKGVYTLRKIRKNQWKAKVIRNW